MRTDLFLDLLARGDAGEIFFCQRHHEVVKTPIALLASMPDWHIEGFDIGAVRLLMNPASGCPDLFADVCINDGKVYLPAMQYGGVEIKTIGDNQFLPRYGNGNLPEGTLGFPLWAGTTSGDGTIRYTHEHHGNLRRWMAPSVESRSARPMVLVILLARDEISPDGVRISRFFASIVFEDVDALFARLTEYGAQHGLHLDDWNSIPIGEAVNTFNLQGLFFQGNMWHVPLSVIGDLATVTMIGDDPVIYQTGRCSVETQQARLDYLKNLAGGRWMPQEAAANTFDDEALLQVWSKKLLAWPVGIHGLLDRNGNPVQ